MRRFSTRQRLLPTQDYKRSPSSSIGSVCPSRPPAATPWSTRPGNRAGFYHSRRPGRFAASCARSATMPNVMRRSPNILARSACPMTIIFGFSSRAFKFAPAGFLSSKCNGRMATFCTVILRSIYAIRPHWRHCGQDYGQEIDRFSALVIYLSLAALERDVTLWERFHTGDNLIFVREDFQQLGRSAIWQHLRRIGSREIDQLAAAVAAMVQQHPMKVGNLDSVLKNPASYPASSKVPTSIPASTPAQRVAPKPARVPTPPVPSWMKKRGYRDHSDD